MSLLAFILWTVFLLAAVVLPGVSLQRLARAPVDPALVIPLGGAWCAGAWWIALASGNDWLFPAATALAGVGLLWPLGDRGGSAPRARARDSSSDQGAEPQEYREYSEVRQRRAGGEDPLSTRSDFHHGLLDRGTGRAFADTPSLRGALPPLLAVVALLALTQYGWNRVGPAGDFVLDPVVTFDSTFHVGVTHELVSGYPPQVPGAAGFPLGYHLGTDLVRAAALRWAGTDPWDSLTRFDVTLWALALILVIRSLLARLGAPSAAVALAPWTLLLTDLSFVFATNPQAHWWADLLRGNLLFSLVYANPIIPALAFALGALVALSRHEESGDRGSLLLAATLAAAVPFFKVFLGAHLLLGLGVAFWMARAAPRRSLVLMALPCAAATAALALGQGGQTVDVVLAPLDLVHVTRATLELAPLGGVALAAWAVLWLVASLGLRVFGVGAALRALRSNSSASTLAVMALSGWPLGLLFRVSAPEVLEGQTIVNDAAYLVEQSGPLLWLFAATSLVAFASTRRRRALAALALVALATPATVQYAVKKRAEPAVRLPAAMVRAMDALEPVSERGDVVLQRPAARYPPAPVILAGRRVPYERFTPYLTQFASREALEARHAEVYRFFRTRDRDEALEVAQALDARFLALYGHDRVRFDTAGVLEPVHEEPDARLYRIVYE